MFQFLVRVIHGMALGVNMAAPWALKLISAFRRHMDLHHTVREKKVIHFDIGHMPCQIWPYYDFLTWAIHGLVPRAKMAAPWGPKLIFTFRGHMALHHPVREKKIIHFDIGHIPCQIWPILRFFGMGHT